VKRAFERPQIFCALFLALGTFVHAEDASIDRLLKKLPPPEKIIKQSASAPAKQQDPALEDLVFKSAFSAALMGDVSQALLYFRKLGEKYPRSEVVLIFWGECAYRLRHYDEAARAFRRATALAPDDSYTWLELAKAENALGHIGTALTGMAKAAEISPNDGELAAVLGFSYINLNRVPQAISPLQRAAKLLPQNYLVQSQLGYCLLTTGQTNAAVGYLQKGATLNSRYGPVWEHLGVAYKRTQW
jgi:Flp pilus assembly protein TadD